MPVSSKPLGQEQRIWLVPPNVGDIRETDIIAPWCGPYRSASFPEPFASPASIRRALSDCLAITRHKVLEWQHILNTRHRRKYSFAYWWILCAPWIFLCVQVAYNRWALLNAISNRFPDQTIIFMGARPPKINRPLGVGGLIRGILASADVHGDLIASFIRTGSQDPRIVHQVYGTANVRSETNFDEKPVIVPEPSIVRLNCRGMSGVGVFAPLLAAIVSLIDAKARPLSGVFRHPPTDPPPPALSQISKVLDPFLAATEPRVLREDYSDLDQTAQKHKVRKGAMRLIGPILTTHEAEKFIVAQAAEAGEILIGSQHGGIGFHDRYAIRSVTEFCLDGYLSWGWTEHSAVSADLVAVASPFFGRFKRSKLNPNQPPILISNSARTLYTQIQSHPQPGQATQYVADRKLFLKALLPDIRTGLEFRPMHDVVPYIDDTNDLRSNFKDIHILDDHVSEKALHRKMMSCPVVICDHPGTSLCISIAANIPTIGFWDPNIWGIEPTAEASMERLISAEIIHRSPESAAEFLNTHSATIQRWWASEQVQEARLVFCETFARTRRIWMWNWICGLRKFSFKSQNHALG